MPTIRDRIRAVFQAHPGQWLDSDQIRTLGEWTEREAKNMVVHLSSLHNFGYCDRIERKRESGVRGIRGSNFAYRLKDDVVALAEKAPPVRVEAIRPLRQDPAAWALANPPRGKQPNHPSMARAVL
jgi:hypothetical protein